MRSWSRLLACLLLGMVLGACGLHCLALEQAGGDAHACCPDQQESAATLQAGDCSTPWGLTSSPSALPPPAVDLAGVDLSKPDPGASEPLSATDIAPSPPDILLASCLLRI